VVSVVFSEELLNLLYGETYLAYSNAMILMALFYGLWFSYWPLQSIFKAARLSRRYSSPFGRYFSDVHRWDRDDPALGGYGTIAGRL